MSLPRTCSSSLLLLRDTSCEPPGCTPLAAAARRISPYKPHGLLFSSGPDAADGLLVVERLRVGDH